MAKPIIVVIIEFQLFNYSSAIIIECCNCSIGVYLQALAQSYPAGVGKNLFPFDVIAGVADIEQVVVFSGQMRVDASW